MHLEYIYIREREREKERNLNQIMKNNVIDICFYENIAKVT